MIIKQCIQLFYIFFSFSLSRHVFQNLPKLKELKLNNNNIRFIQKNAFESARSIETIHLQDNELFINGYNPFQHLSNLRELDLQNNSITEMYSLWPQEHPLLKKFNLVLNGIRVIRPGDLYFFHTEIVINLQANLITTVDFSNLELDLHWIEATNKNLVFKVHLTLSNNPLICDYMMLDFVNYLKNYLAKTVKPVFIIELDETDCSANGPNADRNLYFLKENELLTPSNSIPDCPSQCRCLKRSIDKRLIVKCTNANLKHIPKLPNTMDLMAFELHIQNNNITHLPTLDAMPGYASITELYAHNNQISSLFPNNIPTNLKVLAISNNQLTTMSNDVLQRLNSTKAMEKLYLSNNPWSCTCKIFDLITFAEKRMDLMGDFSIAECYAGANKLSSLSRAELCPNIYMALGVTLIVLLLFITVGMVLYYKYDQEIKVWMFAHNLFSGCISEDELDKDKKYDAFISYSHQDEAIAWQLSETLESGPSPFKVCTHERDWMPGEWIPTQVKIE
jgi:protein toll